MNQGRDAARVALTLSSTLLAAIACTLTHHDATAQTECESGIVVGLTPRTMDAVAELERATGARIERGAAISTDAAAFTVRAAGAAPECQAVVELLRRDLRVRFVEPDARRSVLPAVGQ
jgi:hypothetical protein